MVKWRFNCLFCKEDCDWAGIERIIFCPDECRLGIFGDEMEDEDEDTYEYWYR